MRCSKRRSVLRRFPGDIHSSKDYSCQESCEFTLRRTHYASNSEPGWNQAIGSVNIHLGRWYRRCEKIDGWRERMYVPPSLLSSTSDRLLHSSTYVGSYDQLNRKVNPTVNAERKSEARIRVLLRGLVLSLTCRGIYGREVD